MKINQYFWKIVGKVYQRLYGYEVKEARNFIKNTFYVTFGLAIASVISGIFTIYAGNILGPKNYGTYILITSVSGFLIITCLLGLKSALVHFNVKSTTSQQKKSVISTSLILVSLYIIISCTSFFILSPILSLIFSVPIELVYYAILLTIILSFFHIGTSILESNFMMKKRGYMQILYAVITLISFIVIVEFVRSYLSMLFAVIIGYISAFIMVLYLNRGCIGISYDKNIAKQLFKYGSYVSIAGFSASILSFVDRLVINYYLDSAFVGLYQAYASATLFLPLFIMNIIIIVFFPTASRVKNKKPILERVDRTIKIVPILYVPFLVLGYILFKLYGPAYQFNIFTLMIFSINAILIISTGLYSRLTTSMGIPGVKFLGKFVPLKAGLNVALNFILIPYIGINGAIGTTVVCNMISTLVYRLYYLRKNI